jgi:putative DNA methylase
MLSTKKGKEAYVEPIVEPNGYLFKVRVGQPENIEAAKNGTKLSQGSFRCLLSNTPFRYSYIDDKANAGQIGQRLMAIIAEGKRGRVYLSPTKEMEDLSNVPNSYWKPDAPSRGTWASNAQGRKYGFATFGDYFTNRQLVSLTTFSDLTEEVLQIAKVDALARHQAATDTSAGNGDHEACAYAEAICVYLAFAANKVADRGSTLGRWDPTPTQSGIINTFSRQAISMTWDFAESNPLGDASGNYQSATELVAKSLLSISTQALHGYASQKDASTQSITKQKVVSTDPPYYDNIGYADLSDYFYVWLRRSLRSIFPELFATLAAPKSEELVAVSYRHGSKENAEIFFLEGMTRAMQRIAKQSHPAFPVTIYYAFKQSEAKSASGTASTGWETFLAAVIKAGFALHGTWPIRTELANRMIGSGTNALASSVVLVCQRRGESAANLSRNEFRRQLRQELPKALKELERANIAPVDVAQAAIGPGIAIFSSAESVLNPDDSPMSVRDALIEINTALDEYLSEDEGDLDADSRFALTFFESYGYTERDFGDAENLAKARNVSNAFVSGKQPSN